MRTLYRTAALALLTLAGAGCEALGLRPADYNPVIDPANFQQTVDNPYFPLVPGTVLKYREVADGKELENIIEVMRQTKVILGITCTVVHDVVQEPNGKVVEDTYDWYAQDKQGTVWYFGEDTKEYLPGGKIVTKGSWESGQKGAKPGIIMPGKAEPCPAYWQEYAWGEAEDKGQIVAVNESVTVPYGTFKDCVKTEDWSMLESGSENKWYARGVGFVRGKSSKGDLEELISVTKVGP